MTSIAHDEGEAARDAGLRPEQEVQMEVVEDVNRKYAACLPAANPETTFLLVAVSQNGSGNMAVVYAEGEHALHEFDEYSWYPSDHAFERDFDRIKSGGLFVWEGRLWFSRSGGYDSPAEYEAEWTGAVRPATLADLTRANLLGGAA